MKRIFLTLYILCYSIGVFSSNSDSILYFYQSYMKAVLEGNNKENIIYRYLSPALIGKNQRVIKTVGHDPVLRAQDITENAINSLELDSLGNDWYYVKYSFRKDCPQVTIPLKSQFVDSVFKIIYICPVWNGIQYGDSLLGNIGKKTAIINDSPLSFLRSFYSLYTEEYACLQDSTENKTSELRKKYLSPNAQSSFEKASKEMESDGFDGFDILIDGFDYDYTLNSPIDIELKNSDTYLVSFLRGKSKSFLEIKIKKKYNNYYIDDVQKVKYSKHM